MVDNASTDHTGEQAQHLWEQYDAPAPIMVICETTPGLMAARTAGVQVAQYEFISFVDDDNWIAENWIETVFKTLIDQPSVGACGGHNVAVFETGPPDWFPTFQNLFAVGQQLERDGMLPPGRYELWGAGLSLRRSAWLVLRQYTGHSLLAGRTGKSLSAGEDSEICMLLTLLGYQLYYNHALVVRHYMLSDRLTWNYVERLLEGLARARFPLAVYTRLCQGSQRLIRQTNLYWFTFCGKNLLATAYGWSRWKLSLKPTEGNPYYAKFLFYKSVLKDRNYWVDRQIIKKIHQNYQAVQRCKQMMNEPLNR